MDPSCPPETRRTGSRYGAFAYSTVVLTCYAGFLSGQRYYLTPAWTVPVVFALGAAYAAVGILSGEFFAARGRVGHAVYYTTQCALLTAIMLLSPVRGFVGIVVLP